MRKLGTIDLEVLILAIKENGTFNENNLESSELKRYGVGKILDTLASLKDRKFISLNSDGSFSITQLAREILWNSNIPLWARVLRLLQIKSCSLNEIIDFLETPQDKIITEIEILRKNQFILMSPQRKSEKLIKMYEILPEGIHKIDKTETDGFFHMTGVVGCKQNVSFWIFSLHMGRGVPTKRKLLDCFTAHGSWGAKPIAHGP